MPFAGIRISIKRQKLRNVECRMFNVEPQKQGPNLKIHHWKFYILRFKKPHGHFVNMFRLAIRPL